MLSTAPPPSRRRALVVLPLAWAALVFFLTLTPAQEMPNTPHWELLAFDTAAHAFVFLVQAVLTVFSARRQAWFPQLRTQAFSATLLLTVGMGAGIEVLQMLMDLGRQGEWSDLLSDSLGVIAGLLLMWTTRRFWQ
ncbi:VanZ family protein [Hymenobacter sp. HSC-4F20]|uniref:VanZ family protein n=1 Tax=Hymenobacter sp. HSC-4F20 TaxID=2864135 RepID=UPI001C737468|nr:VanZ family protein [Hymenobacter sp. HSC-4F20]MBX0291367.1 VanZ family protein [Hymenobacter sp. HSC-4F20]